MNKQLSIEELKKLRACCNGNVFSSVLDELISFREQLKGDQVPVAYLYMGDAMECKNVQLAEDTDEGQAENCIPLFTHPQVPAGNDMSLADYCEQASKIVRSWPQWKQDGADVTKFAAPQKPVVKLAGDMTRGTMYAMGWNDRGLADKLTIEAAGGTVKDGE